MRDAGEAPVRSPRKSNARVEGGEIRGFGLVWLPAAVVIVTAAAITVRFRGRRPPGHRVPIGIPDRWRLVAACSIAAGHQGHSAGRTQ
jgi:hypothetical protein